MSIIKSIFCGRHKICRPSYFPCWFMTRTVFVQCVAKKSQASSAALYIPKPKYRLLSTSYYSTLLLNGLAALNLISGKCFVNFQFFSNPESPPHPPPRPPPPSYPQMKRQGHAYRDMEASFQGCIWNYPSPSSSSPETRTTRPHSGNTIVSCNHLSSHPLISLSGRPFLSASFLSLPTTPTNDKTASQKQQAKPKQLQASLFVTFLFFFFLMLTI